MPPFGLRHKLLSARHSDTSPPLAGADPDDGQVATWSTALKAWIAADPAGNGVGDHGLLDGLADDDHPHYALADKSRPATWVAAADLAARSIADLGAKGHSLLTGLSSDDHAQYALLSGRSGGQTLWGSPIPGELLTLKGGVKVDGNLGIMCDPTDSVFLLVEPAGVDLAGKKGIDLQPTNPVMGTGVFTGISGTVAAGITSGKVASLNALAFNAAVAAGGGGAVAVMRGIYNRFIALSFDGTINEMVGFRQRTPSILNGDQSITVSRGIHLENQGVSPDVVDVESLKIDDITGNTGNRYLLEIGPATPYLRLHGGNDPPPNTSNLRLKIGSTLCVVYSDGVPGILRVAAV